MRLMELKPMELKRDSERDAERDSQDTGGVDDGAAKVVQLYEPEPIDAGLAAHIAWIKEQPEADRRLHLANLAAGVGAKDVGVLVAAAMSDLKPKERVGVAIEVCERLLASERAEVMSRVTSGLPALVEAYDRASPREQRELDERRPRRTKARKNGPKIKVPAIGKRSAALYAMIVERESEVTAGRVFSAAQHDKFRYESSCLFAQILGALEWSRPPAQRLLELPEREKQAWQSAPEIEQQLWRTCEAKANDPEVRAINEQAKSDGPVRPAAVKSQLGRFVK